MVTETLELVVRQRGADSAASSIRGIGTAARTATAELRALNTNATLAMSGLGTGFKEAFAFSRSSLPSLLQVGRALNVLERQQAARSLGLLGPALASASVAARDAHVGMTNLGMSITNAVSAQKLVGLRTFGRGLSDAMVAAKGTALGVANLGTGISEAVSAQRLVGLRTFGRGLNDAVIAARSAQTGMANLGVGITEAVSAQKLVGLRTFGRGLNDAMVAAERSRLGMSNLGAALTQSMQTMVRTENASRVAGSGIRQVGADALGAARNVSAMRESLAFMRSTLVALSFLRAFEGVFEAVNQFQLMNNQLRTVTRNVQEAASAQTTLAKLAVETRSNYESTVTVFSNLTRYTLDMKLNYGQLLELTKVWNESLVISGASMTNQRNAFIDFVHMLSLGVVQARNLRGLLTQDPVLLQAIAHHLDQAQSKTLLGWVEKAKAQGQKIGAAGIFGINEAAPGSIRSADLIKALLQGGAQELEKTFAKTTQTIGQSFEVLKTKALYFFATLGEHTGALSWLTDTINWLGDHLPQVTMAATALVSLLTFNMLTSALTSAGGTFSAFFSILFGGFGRLLGLLRSVAVFLIAIDTPIAGIAAAFAFVGAVVLAAFWKPITQAFGGLENYVKQSGGWLQVLINGVAAIGAAFQSVWDIIRQVFDSVSSWVGATFGPIFKDVKWLVTEAAHLVGKVVSTAWSDVSSAVAGSSVGQSFASNYQKHFAENKKAIGSLVSGTEGFFGQFDLANARGGLMAKLFPPGAGSEMPIDKGNEVADAKAALSSLMGVLGQFGGPAEKFAADMAKVSKSLHDLVTPHGKKAAAYTPEEIKKIFNSYGFDFNTKTMESTKLIQMMDRSVLGLKNSQTEYKSLLDEVTAAEKRHSISLEEGNRLLAAKRIQLLLTNTASVSSGVQAGYLNFGLQNGNHAKIAEDEITSVLKEDKALSALTVQYQALEIAKQRGIITTEMLTKATRDLQLKYLKTQTDMSSGFVRGMLDVQKAMQDTATVAETTLKKAFSDVSDALTKFFDTGRFNLKSFLSDLQTGLTKMAVHKVFMGPLTNLLGFGAGQTSGSSPLTGLLGSIFGGGALPGLSGLGPMGSQANPMWVIPMTSTGTAYDMINSAAQGMGLQMPTIGQLQSGLPGAANSNGGWLMNMFNKSGIFGSQGFFSNLFSGTGGGAGSTSSSILSALGDVGSWLGFAGGGAFTVGGSGAVDTTPVMFMATQGERVSVQTPAQQRAAANANSGPPVQIALHVHGVSNPNDFQQTQGQVVGSLMAEMQKQMKRNGTGG